MNQNEKIPLLVIVGPTASGKTRLAVDLARRHQGEIISADSMQIYQGMEIGTAKPTKVEQGGIPHHLIDFLSPGDSFSVAEYVRLAKRAIADIRSRGRMPVVAGGTGLYIRALIDGMPFETPAQDRILRTQLETLAEEKGNEAVHRLLSGCDPELAQQLHPNNRGRVIRAIEVYRSTGVPMSEWQRRSKERSSPYDPCILGLDFRDRAKLYRRIDARVDQMMERGLLNEVQRFYQESRPSTAAQAIGYKELRGALNGETQLEQAVEHLKQQTRRYAKRQLTWFRRDTRIQWIYLDEEAEWENCIVKSEKYMEEFSNL